MDGQRGDCSLDHEPIERDSMYSHCLPHWQQMRTRRPDQTRCHLRDGQRPSCIDEVVPYEGAGHCSRMQHMTDDDAQGRESSAGRRRVRPLAGRLTPSQNGNKVPWLVCFRMPFLHLQEGHPAFPSLGNHHQTDLQGN